MTKRGYRNDQKETSADSNSALQTFYGFCGYGNYLVFRADVGVRGSNNYFGEAK
jgi:hypothetical protein